MCGRQGMHGREHGWQGHAWLGHVWQGACMAGGMSGRGLCVAGGCVWQGDVHDRKNSNCSGQYTSYWNAFLFISFGHVNTAILSRIQGNLLRFSEDGLGILHTTGFLTR